MNNFLISNFNLSQIPWGGSELVNDFIMKELGFDFVASKQVKYFPKENFYIISNVSLMSQDILKGVLDCNYIIIEHDYSKISKKKFVWEYPDCILPIDDKYCWDLYKNAKAVFFQTTDHMNTYLKNNYSGNFINMRSGIWSWRDLELLELLSKKEKIDKCVVFDSSGTLHNDIKNTIGAIEYCQNNNLEFVLVGRQPREKFLNELSNYSKLVFIPLARESMCRMVIEARCMNMILITTKNYGAVLEDYIEMGGKDLIDFLRNQTKINLELIKGYIK